MKKIKIVKTVFSGGRYAVGDIVYVRGEDSPRGLVRATHQSGEDVGFREADRLPGNFVLYPEEFELVVEAAYPNLGTGSITIQADELSCLLYPEAFSKDKQEGTRTALRAQLAGLLGNA